MNECSLNVRHGKERRTITVPISPKRRAQLEVLSKRYGVSIEALILLAIAQYYDETKQH
jgi:hypothetical protein